MSHTEDGYVSDVEYITGYYPLQAPAHLDAVCLLNGIAPPDRRNGFAWCELGCGQGLTANLLAASYPEATFHGVDYLPPHIAHARDTARAANLTNAFYHQTTFADVIKDASLPLFDYVTLHGVYSWVSPQVQADILRFLDRQLKPGGLVLVSYNVLPGWHHLAPLQRLLRLHAAGATPGTPSDRRVRDALAFARTLQSAGAPGLGEIDIQQITIPQGGWTAAQHMAYLAHEYLDADWRLLLHADVARDCATVGLTYAGSAQLFHNIRDLVLTDDQQSVLEGVADPTLRESMVDYCTRQSLRHDVFVRKPVRLSSQQRDNGLRGLPLALVHSAVSLPHQIRGAGRTIELGPDAYGPILDALSARICTIGDLLDLPALRGLPDRPTPADLLVALSGTGFAPVCGRVIGAATESQRLFNRLQAVETLAGRQPVAAFATANGLGVAVGRAGAALYLLLTEGVKASPPELAALTMRRMVEAGAVPPQHWDLVREIESTVRLMPAYWHRHGCL